MWIAKKSVIYLEPENTGYSYLEHENSGTQLFKAPKKLYSYLRPVNSGSKLFRARKKSQQFEARKYWVIAILSSKILVHSYLEPENT